MKAKEIAKELRKGAKVSICYKTLSGTVGILELSKINGFFSMIEGTVGHAGNGDLVVSQTSELIDFDYAERLIFDVMFSTEIINYSVSLSYY